MPETKSSRLTVGAAAKAAGIDAWQLDALYRRGILPEPERLGRFRIVDRSDLDKIRAAAIEAGYLTEKATT